MNFLQFLNNNIVLLDGAMGTMLQKNGMKAGDVPEHFNIEQPDIIVKIQKAYVDAGSNVIFTNTFGANAKKLANSPYSLEQIIKAAVANAKTAMGNKGFVAYDIGPIGELLQPSGLLSFDEAYQLFAQQVKIAVAEGVDLFVIETMTDLQEVRAAVLAVKENSSLPVLASMSFEETGRTFTGCDVAAMACCLEGLGVDALGINCSLGPVQLLPVVEKLLNYTSLPVSVKANAGLPTKHGGYDIDELEFTDVYQKFLKMGVRLVGGCCGTTPEYIALLKKAVANAPKDVKKPDTIRGICSGEKFLPYGGIQVVGERLNPTGKPLFKEAILNENIEYILKQALEQVEAGADILDLNLGLPKIDEASIMEKVITALQGVSDIPLQIDSSKPVAIEAALRRYCGKAIVNSVNGDDESLDAILPIVKKYGAAVVGLCLNKDGIPKNAEDRLKIAEYILQRCLSYGIKREDVIIDCLALTVSAEQDRAIETLRAIELVSKNLGLKTTLGVSNISFGLPQREHINATFLACALDKGLSLPIINPNSSIMNTVYAYKVINCTDLNSDNYIQKYRDVVTESNTKHDDYSLESAILKGLKQECAIKTEELLNGNEALDVVNNYLIPALDKVGMLYEKGRLFLPQLLQAAEAAKCGFDVIKANLAKNNEEQIKKGTIVLATVKGDIHDIGKNIVKTVLENYGYTIVDLGRDVPIDDVVNAAKKHNAGMVGLSALMTSTVENMEATIKAIRQAGLSCKVLVGGAVLTEDYAMDIGADMYAKDANQAVEKAKLVFGE